MTESVPNGQDHKADLNRIFIELDENGKQIDYFDIKITAERANIVTKNIVSETMPMVFDGKSWNTKKAKEQTDEN